MILKLLKYLSFVLFNPIWYLQLLIPRNKKIWIFGSWFGEKYSDNAKALFEYVLSNDSSINVIWLTRNNSVKNKLKSEGKKCYSINSFQGIKYSLIADKIIISSGKKDINQFFINGAKIIQLWHGAPMKKIGFDDEYHINKLFQFFLKIFFPFIYEYNYSFVISTAPVFNSKLSSAFDINQNKILLTGYPRNDIFFKSNFTHPIVQQLKNKYINPNIILFLPTFRDYRLDINLFEDYSFNNERFNDFLIRTNSVLIIKGHHVNNDLSSPCPLDFERILNLKGNEVQEINPILKSADILLTDYCAAYFDFLLTEKPIIFTAFDLKEYTSNSRELYFDYDEIIAGPIAKNWIEVEKLLEKSLKNDEFYNIRQTKNAHFNAFRDKNSSERVYKSIIENS